MATIDFQTIKLPCCNAGCTGPALPRYWRYDGVSFPWGPPNAALNELIAIPFSERVVASGVQTCRWRIAYPAGMTITVSKTTLLTSQAMSLWGMIFQSFPGAWNVQYAWSRPNPRDCILQEGFEPVAVVGSPGGPFPLVIVNRPWKWSDGPLLP
jgi:hypothetical protein